jgi:hypothetical protein
LVYCDREEEYVPAFAQAKIAPKWHYLSKTAYTTERHGFWSRVMQQPHLGDVTIYRDITEVRLETRAADCKKFLADGWVLLGVYPLTTVGEPAHRKSRREQTENKPKDTQQRVQRMVGYVLGKRRES